MINLNYDDYKVWREICELRWGDVEKRMCREKKKIIKIKKKKILKYLRNFWFVKVICWLYFLIEYWRLKENGI